mmetsp:Transcript_17617/g.48726  ORF Transcript_17617/g.48726 Transcript_17617/m.48726 type:complete len:207 (-) Transcript_17617:147-767(-)
MVRAAHKRRKLVHDSTSITNTNTKNGNGNGNSSNVMKHNKLAMATFGTGGLYSNVQNGSHSQHELSASSSSSSSGKPHKHQSICQFLAHAERIAVSTAAVDLACEHYEQNNHSNNLALDNNNNSNGNNECGGDHSLLQDSSSFSYHEDSLQDSITNDEKLVQAIIANDDRLNKEVGELFEMDSFLKDDEDECERDEIADCLMGCML